jgi:hypothetical protein
MIWIEPVNTSQKSGGGNSGSDKNWFKIPPESGAKITIRYCHLGVRLQMVFLSM